MVTDGQTDRQTDKPSTVTLAAHARRVLIMEDISTIIASGLADTPDLIKKSLQ